MPPILAVTRHDFAGCQGRLPEGPFDAVIAAGIFERIPGADVVNGKVTLVHRRLWPALVRIADRFPAKNLAAIHEEHTASGAHRVQAEAFPAWVPNDVLQAAKALSVEDALTELPAYFRRS